VSEQKRPARQQPPLKLVRFKGKIDSSDLLGVAVPINTVDTPLPGKNRNKFVVVEKLAHYNNYYFMEPIWIVTTRHGTPPSFSVVACSTSGIALPSLLVVFLLSLHEEHCTATTPECCRHCLWLGSPPIVGKRTRTRTAVWLYQRLERISVSGLCKLLTHSIFLKQHCMARTNHFETKRNERKRIESNPIQTKRNESKRNESKRNEKTHLFAERNRRSQNVRERCCMQLLRYFVTSYILGRCR